MGKLEVKKILGIEVWANFRENTNHYYKWNLRRVSTALITCVALPILVYKLTAIDYVRNIYLFFIKICFRVVVPLLF